MKFIRNVYIRVQTKPLDSPGVVNILFSVAVSFLWFYAKKKQTTSLQYIWSDFEKSSPCNLYSDFAACYRSLGSSTQNAR